MYSTHDIGMALIFLPISALRHWGVLPPSVADLAYVVINPVFGAVLVATVFRFGWRLSGDRGAAVWSAFVLAGCTYLLAYARISFDAIPTATALVAAIYLAWRGIESHDVGRITLAGLCGAAAVLVRTDSVVMLAGVSVWVVWWSWRRRSAMPLFCWSAPLVGALAVNAWFNWARYGGVLRTGHADDPQTTFRADVWYGAVGQLVSPGKGLLFFAPPVIIAVIGWRQMLRDQRALGMAMLSGGVATLLLFSAIENWSGAEAVGPRFLVPVLVVLWAPAVFVFARWSDATVGVRAGVIALCAIGAAVQVGLGVSQDVAINRLHGGRLHLEAFRSSQIVYSWEALWDGLMDRPITEGGVVPAPVARLDVWWAGASPHIATTPAVRVIALALAVSAASLAWTAIRCAGSDGVENRQVGSDDVATTAPPR